LLSRFDLIFSIQDKPSEDQDVKLASHILNTHKAGEVNENIMKSKETKYTREQKEALFQQVIPVLSPEFLRKYVAYAKRHVFPVMHDDAMSVIKDYYVSLRSQSKDSVPFTPRQLEAFVRLAEASARVRLSEEVTISDAKRSIAIINEYLRRVGMDRETGNFDIDIIATGISHSQHERMRSIIDIIKSIGEESKDGNAARNEILVEAEAIGMDATKVGEILDKMKRNGQIYEPSHGKYRVTEY